MKRSKLLALAVGLLMVGGIGSNADIGFQFQGRGGYLPGGSFEVGPWPDVGSYYQVLWSADEPSAIVVDQGLVATSEMVLYENWTVKPYGYFDPTPLIVVRDAQVPNVNTSGYLYTRLYSDAAPVAGTYFTQSPGVPNSTLPVYDAQNPATIALLVSPVGLELSGTVIPEPSTGILLALSGLVLVIRRRMTH